MFSKSVTMLLVPNEMKRHERKVATNLLSLIHPLVHKLGEGLPGNESTLSRTGQNFSILICHLSPGDGHHGNTVAHHALKDVVVHGLMVSFG